MTSGSATDQPGTGERGTGEVGLTPLAARIRSGARSSEDLTRSALAAAENDECGAFVDLLPNQALDAARQADRAFAAGIDHGPLQGIPIGVKDNIDVAGAWTRFGTAGLGHHLAESDAAVVTRLRAAGAVVIGKTRTHELTWGMITHGCRNPHDPTRIVGGSSGGSAAAVAAGIVPLTLGTDTGGSVRNPAALCGVTGVKTGVDAISMAGISPMAPTQDTVGVLAATIGDCRVALEALHLDQAPAREIRRVGLISDSWARRVEPEVAAAVDRAANDLRAAGIDVVDIPVAHSSLASVAAYVIMLTEAARQWWPANHAVGPEVREMLRLGAQVADADYARALEVRAAIRSSVDSALREVDALMLASCPVVANPIGVDLVSCAGRTIPVTNAHSALTSLASVAGLPALSVPGITDGLPVGVQLIGADTGSLCGCAELIEPTSAGTTAVHSTEPDRSATRAEGR